MKFVVVIPARMSSSRFPGKPLADICGMPMVEHVRRRVLLNPKVSNAIVATCDKEICDVVREAGGESLMTSSTHFCCNDRVAEAVQSLDSDIVINVQGDEPLFDPNMIDILLEPMIDNSDVLCTNLMAEIENEREFRDINEVKVVCDIDSNAVYMSRESIPSTQKSGDMKHKFYKQLGVYAYTRDSILKFGQWGPSPLESMETIDMVRFIEHGIKVRMICSPFPSIGVDTPNELEVAESLMKADKYFGGY